MAHESQSSLFSNGLFNFADRFLQDHTGRITTDPKIALVELIANSYDAGATEVEFEWPELIDHQFSITDNGTGMSRSEFEHRWRTFNYDRLSEQGPKVVFPPSVVGIKRTPFGQSGKGRHAPFCFSESYEIITWKDGRATRAVVSLANGGAPFEVNVIGEFDKEGHGTIVTAVVERHRLEKDDLSQLIGSKFLIDPSFSIKLNGSPILLMALDGLETSVVEVPPHGSLKIHFLDTSEHSRTAKLRGITWWVHRRMVGEPGWERLDDEGTYLDGRREEAKRFSFIVEADFLKPKVKSDWSGFNAEKMTEEASAKVHHHVLNKLQVLLSKGRKFRKIEAMEKSRRLLNDLPGISKKTVSRFIDEVLEKCTSITDRDLQRTVEILARLEESRFQYDLIKQLSECSLEDLDKWTTILKQWSASTAELILGELQRRLRLIERMQQLVEDSEADELHQLQPLFERGLWIFGTEYEAVDFRSNRGLTEVIGNFLGNVPGSGKINDEYSQPRMRIDLIALPDRSIGAYSADSYTNGEVSGIRKVLIVELKRGGFRLTQGEVDQARNYAKEIKRSGRVQRDTQIEAVVLGAYMEDDLSTLTLKDLNISIVPRAYDSVLQQARLRTFNLERKLKELEPIPKDPDVERVFQDHPLLP